MRWPRVVLVLSWSGAHRAARVPWNSQYSSAWQQTGAPFPTVRQMRFPEQQVPPWQISLAWHWPLPLQTRLARAQCCLFSPCLRAQTKPLRQHLPLQHAALAQHRPPQLTVPNLPRSQHLPLRQRWSG